MFHVRRRPADYHPRKRKKKPPQAGKWGKDGLEGRYDDNYERLPFFLELNPGECPTDSLKRFFFSFLKLTFLCSFNYFSKFCLVWKTLWKC